MTGNGTFTAILSGNASLAAENFSGTFTINPGLPEREGPGAALCPGNVEKPHCLGEPGALRAQ
jgi:hypothetical protein